MLQRACSFTADLPVTCSYVYLIDDDCSAVGVLGKIPCLFCTFSRASSAGSLIYTGIQDALHQCVPTGSVCWSPALSKLSIMPKFLHKTREMQILQAHFFKSFYDILGPCSRIQVQMALPAYQKHIKLYKRGHQMLLMKALICNPN